MRTVSYFEHAGRSVHIRKVAQLGPRSATTYYRAYLDGGELPVSWPNARELELAIRRLLDETESTKV